MSTQGVSFRAEHSIPATPPCDGCPSMVRCGARQMTCRAFNHYETTGRAVPLYREQDLRRLKVETDEV